jgi:hypothetical protein
MSVAIIGGLDRLKRNYERTGLNMGFDIKCFFQRIPDIRKRLNGFKAIVIFTGTTSHPLVTDVLRAAKQFNIPVERSHSSGVSSLKRCLGELNFVEGAI